MSSVVELLRSRRLPLASVLALVTGLAGCSAESTRFNENPFASKGPAETTGSVPQYQGAPVGRIESQALPPAAARPAPVATNYGTVGGGRGMASYSPAAATSTPYQVASQPLPPPDVTGSVGAQPPRPPANGRWTWDGGTPVVVAQGDTVDGISRKYGVPPTALMHANNITAQAALYPGQQLVIPRFVPNQTATPAAPPPTRVASASPLAAPPAVAPPRAATPVASGPAGVHVVAPGETLSKISRLYGKPVGEIAKANNLRATSPLKIGDRLTIPGIRTSAANPKIGVSVAQAKAAVPAASKEIVSEPVATVSLAKTSDPAPHKDTVAIAEGAGGLPTFRWPANGRVIAGFGTSPNGLQNDGINLALPEGTSVKSAEDGVVAYAGNELKGYGNLVLVRHPNGYVTAYAHAKEILVKRGDQVKRGQVIARSGQTGNVNAPQLHFEIRKGASPLDPMRFLKGV
jgi:murein DD-endopeptidase MepM/ murein hydrolase activator NlpD